MISDLTRSTYIFSTSILYEWQDDSLYSSTILIKLAFTNPRRVERVKSDGGIPKAPSSRCNFPRNGGGEVNARAISGPPSRRYACSTTAFVRFTGELFALFREEGKKKAFEFSVLERGTWKRGGARKCRRKCSFVFAPPPPRWERSQVGRGPRATKFTTPFALRHPRHDSVMATRGGYPFGFSLICPAIKHAAESPLADTFYRRASLDVDRERERLLYLCKGSPPSGNFMASGFSARLVRLSSSFVGRKEALYIQSWGLRRISCRPFKRCSRHNVNSFFDRVLSRWDPRIRCWWIVAPFNRCQRKCFEKWNPSPLAYSPSRWLIFNLWMEAFLARG